jgi:hypothetical protein
MSKANASLIVGGHCPPGAAVLPRFRHRALPPMPTAALPATIPRAGSGISTSPRSASRHGGRAGCWDTGADLWGTEGSNPSLSSGESDANLTFGGRAVSFATFQTTTYGSGGSLKSAARRIRKPGGSARETHGIGTPARCRAANRPSVTGMLSWVWVNALLMWAGMSPGPSSLWRYGATYSGTAAARRCAGCRG